MKNLGNLKKVLISLLIVGAVTSVVSAGTFASFAASTSNPGEVFATGTLSMNTSQPGASFASLSNMIPGDSVTQLLAIQNTGTEDIANYRLSTIVTTATTILDSDTVNGLKVYVQRCSVPWTGTGPSATCGGTASDALGTSGSPVPIIQTDTGLLAGSTIFCSSNASAVSQRATRTSATCAATDNDYLKVRVNLPGTAGNTFQGLSDTIQFTWKGDQLTGASF